VAAELIVTTILSALAKLGKHMEAFYDVIASTDKLGYLFDLNVERHHGTLGGLEDNPMDVTLTNLRCSGGSWMANQGLATTISAGSRVAILGPAGSGKTCLARLLYGLEDPAAGHVELGGCNPRELRPDVLRSAVAMIGEPELFTGTLAENVALGRPNVTAGDVRRALESVGMLESVLRLRLGFDTQLNAAAQRLSSTDVLLLMLARAIAGRPRLLVLDGLLDPLPDAERDHLLHVLTDDAYDWTLIVTTGQRQIADCFQRQILLMDPASEGGRA